MFVYFDPPYLGTTATYNENNGWDSSNEKDLYEIADYLTRKNVKWAMSNVTNNKGKIHQELIDWLDRHKDAYKVHSFNDVNYTACGKGNSNATEVLITNY